MLMFAKVKSKTFGSSCKLAGFISGGESVEELIEIARHDAVDLVQRRLNAVVLHAAVRCIALPDPLRALAGAPLDLAVIRAHLAEGALFRLSRLRAWNIQDLRAVLDLG